MQSRPRRPRRPALPLPAAFSRRALAGTPLLLLLAAPLALRAQTAAAPLAVRASATVVPESNVGRMANDHYTRSHDYDLVHQRIEIGDFDWDSTSFTGRVSTTLVALRPGMDSVRLDAGALLRIDRAHDAQGHALAVTARGDTLVIRLARSAAFHDTVRFTLEYHGRVRNGHGLTFITSDGRPHRPRQIWSQGEDDNNHDWFPTYDFPNDKMTWEVVATVPAGYTAVSNGRLRATRTNADGTRTFDWAESRPAATYLVSLVVGPFAHLHDHWRDVPVDYYVYHEDSARAWPLFHETPRMMEVYSQLTGVPYPWEKYAETTVADFFGGMENVSATTLVDWLPDARAYHDRPWYQYVLIPHELAHQWFGDYTTTENWANMWLNEGFAEFMPGAYWGRVVGPHASDDYYLDEYRQFASIDHERSMPLASLGSNNIYPKGALVLRMLERYLGEDRFWASVHFYLTRHAFGNATSDDFRQAVLAATGENLDWFWDEWVYQRGYPAFDVTARYDSTAHRLSLTVSQTQRDSSTVDSTGLRVTTPAAFHMPVTIRVGTAAGDVTAHAELDAREQTIVVDGIASAPTMVVFDDGNTILKSLHFAEPTSWLAEQLRRDPDLWNRSWAIDQLAARTTDSAAARALASAATGADYYRTRAEAAAAFGAFPQDVALPALAAAVRDSSAAVRASAVAALGRVGGDGALALARAAFDRDASDDVRAAALSSVVRLDTVAAARHAVIAAGLATPSYRDVVLGAAMRAVARTGDTSFTTAVAAHIDGGSAAVFVLAALAARGNAHALDLLSSALNDPRADVRNLVVLAFRRVLAPAVATPRLRALASSLKYDDTRQAVDGLMGELTKQR